MNRERRILGVVVAAICAIAMGAGPAGAATITVTTTSDELDSGFGDTGCSLREAIQAANTNTTFPSAVGQPCTADGAPDTIVLQAGQTYMIAEHGLNDGVAIDDDNTDGDFDISDPVTIRSSGADLATVDGGWEVCPCDSTVDRVMEVLSTAGQVRLERLRVTHGLMQGGASPAARGNGGGGILNEANLTIVDSEVVENSAASATGFGALGGGIYTRGPLGSLTMSGSTVADNAATSAAGPGDTGKATGGGIAAYEGATSVNLTNVTISGNQAIGAAGNPGQVGGIFTSDGGLQAPTTLNGVTITGNAGTLGGGMQVFTGTASGVLVAGNTDANGTFPDCGGFPDSLGGNVLGNRGTIDVCAFNLTGPGDLAPTDASPNPILVNLGNLLPNGGPTRTHAPNAGSPAIDRGGPCPELDQRGFARGPVAPCDSGAFEAGAQPPVPPQVVVPPPPAPTGQRAAALKRCKKKKSKKARKKCKRKAKKLPV